MIEWSHLIRDSGSIKSYLRQTIHLQRIYNLYIYA